MLDLDLNSGGISHAVNLQVDGTRSVRYRFFTLKFAVDHHTIYNRSQSYELCSKTIDQIFFVLCIYKKFAF